MLDYFRTPVTANFILTRNCNGNCRFCGVEHRKDNFAPEAPLEKIESIVDVLYENDVLRINFFGGEPFVYPRVMEAMAYAKELRFYNSAVTNGLYVPRDFEKYAGCLDALAVSVHGTIAEHCALGGVSEKTYRRLRENLSFYSSLGIPLTVNMTVTPSNYRSIPGFVRELMEEYRISAFAFNRFIPSPEAVKNGYGDFIMDAARINESLRLIDLAAGQYPDAMFKYAIHFPYCIVEDESLLKYVGSCGFGQNYFSIDCDGNVQACSYSDRYLGNIFEKPLADIWGGDKDLTDYRALKWLPEKCRLCKHLKSCMTGCKVTGSTMFSPDILLEEGI